MRLSDVKGERTLDVIADIIDPIANIAQDPDASELFIRKALPDGMTPRGFMLQRVRASVPALLKGHKADVITILSAIDGTSPDKYAGALNLAKLFKDCVELMTDEAFMVFFTSDEAATDGPSSGENTDASTGEA